MLGQRRRRWPRIGPSLCRLVLLVGVIWGHWICPRAGHRACHRAGQGLPPVGRGAGLPFINPRPPTRLHALKTWQIYIPFVKIPTWDLLEDWRLVEGKDSSLRWVVQQHPFSLSTEPSVAFHAIWVCVPHLWPLNRVSLFENWMS